MTIRHSTGTLFEPQIRSGLRLGLTLTITLMVISSPIFMLVNPASAAAPSYSTDGSPSAPSTIGQDGSDFTVQAPLTGVSARQTNNIVGVQSYYDVVFTTSTTGTIKFIDITFPAGTVIGAAPLLVEREGIGAGTAAKTSATQIRYTVTSAVSVPANTQIRLELFNIVNPTLPNTVYKVTVTTKTAGGTTIDGPTASNSLNMKQISEGQIALDAVTTTKIANGAVTSGDIADGAITSTKPAESFMKKVVLPDNAGGNARGWNPDGADITFTITGEVISSDTMITILVSEAFAANHFCDVTELQGFAQRFLIACSNAPLQGAELHYVVENLPAHVS